MTPTLPPPPRVRTAAKLRVVTDRTPTLAEDIADFHRVEAEQRERKARILAAGRAIAFAEGRRMMPRFEDILREHQP